MSQARIYQRSKNATQSGRARTGAWVLEFMSDAAMPVDPLTGWNGSLDTQHQVRLSFPSVDAARAYAARHGIDAHVVPAPQPKLKLQAYADNFR
jgi:hypothetical protein